MSKKDVDVSGPKPQKARSNYDGQEHESLRRGTEARLKEKVVDAVEDKGCHDRARNARFAATNESAAPTLEDAVRERALTATARDSASYKKRNNK
jgi:hypothetical protein